MENIKFIYSERNGDFVFDRTLPEIEGLYDGWNLEDVNLVKAVLKEVKMCNETTDMTLKAECDRKKEEAEK